MNKTYKYTFLTLFLAFIFVLGSIVGMNGLLQFREKQLLTESGKVIVESPVRAWYGRESNDENENFHNEKNMLTEEQIADVIRSWNSRETEQIHNPVEGQISMETAIQIGEKWIAEIGASEGNEQGTDMLPYSVKAILGVGEQKGDTGKQLEPYYSFWTVEFSNQSRKIVMHVNAVTGKVWRAKVILYDDFSGNMQYEDLLLFVEMAGFTDYNAEAIVVNKDGTQAMLEMENSLLYGQAEYSYIPFKGKGYYNIQENVDNQGEITFEQGYMEITYEILPNSGS